jgi:prepilin-type N-terminal cleavage/methylation domain-containing protein
MTRFHRRSRQRMGGFSLVELSVVLVVLGIAGVLLVRWLTYAHAEQKQVLQRTLLQRADDALLAYVSARHHLPCPAAGIDGIANCTLSTGFLPHAELGLPEPRAGRIRYAVYRNPAITGVDPDLASVAGDLAVAVDRAPVLQMLGNATSGSISAQVALPTGCATLAGVDCTAVPALKSNGLDFCYALRTAMNAPALGNQAHTIGSSGRVTNVAYALALTDPATSAPMAINKGHTFASPRREAGNDYQDKVRAVGMEQLWSRLRCGESLGSALHAHANAAAAASLNVPAMDDYQEQIEIMVDLAHAGDLGADAAIVLSVAQIFSATAGIFDSIGETANSIGGWSWRVPLSTVGLGSALGATTASAAFKAKSVENVKKTAQLRSAFLDGTPASDDPDGGIYPLQLRATALYRAVSLQAQRADMLGITPGPAERAEIGKIGVTP